MNGLASLDLSLYHNILYAPHPPWLNATFIFVTRPENFVVGLVVAVFFLLLWGGGRGRALVLSAGVGVALSDPLASRILKSLFHRIRPCHGESPAHLPLGCSDSYSFPSSHAVNIFCEATIISLIYPRATPYAAVFAAIVGYSRVYLGVHYPFDVMGGAAIGVATGIFVVRVLSRIPVLSPLFSGSPRP
ncbi:MAG: phosphatase PAP2 family protein [Leptospirillia bacterium]